MKKRPTKLQSKKSKHCKALGATVSQLGQLKKSRRRRNEDSTTDASMRPFGFENGVDATKIIANSVEAEPAREIVEWTAHTAGKNSGIASSAKEVRCAIYARSATFEANIAEQVEGCARAIAQHHSSGWQVDRVYLDRGCSGNSVDHPGISQLMIDAKAARFSIVVLSSVDRLARDSRLVGGAFEALEGLGIRVHTVQDGEVMRSSAVDRFTHRLVEAAGELERGLAMARAQEARLSKAKQGRWHGGTPPFGYCYDVRAQAVRENPEEADVVRFIFSELAGACSVGELLNKLRSRGSRTRGSKKLLSTGSKRTALGRPFSASRLRSIVANPFYRGVVRVRNRDVAGKDRGSHGSFLEFVGLHEGIVSNEQWKAANASLKG